MLLLRPTKLPSVNERARSVAHFGGASRRVASALARAGVVVGVAVLVVACGSARPFPDKVRKPAASDGATSSESASSAGAASQTSATGGGTPGGASVGTASGAASSPGAPVSARALSDFERAVGLMRAGKANDAELEFKQLTAGYPQLVGAYINLAILQRKANHLDEAETTLKSAVEKNPASASAWNELGLTQRMRGEFPDAAASYEKAIAADPNFAAAHRNYAVLLDLYMGDAERALTELERYKELTSEEKPVSGWIAELRQRTGKPPAPRPGAAPAAAPAGASPTEAAPAESDPSGAPSPTAPAQPAKPAAETPQPRAGNGA